MYLECCKIVGVKPGADEGTIKTAYRKAAKELHPDLNSSENAHRYFIILQKAYKFLIDNPYQPPKVNDSRYYRNKDINRSAYSRTAKSSTVHYNYTANSKQNLNDILKQSLLARFLFILFHLLFLTAGLYLMVTPVYNVLTYPLNPETQDYSSYFVMIFAFLMGILFTAVFLFSGISFLKRK